MCVGGALIKNLVIGEGFFILMNIGRKVCVCVCVCVCVIL